MKIKKVELSEAITEKFNQWFADVAKPEVDIQTTFLEMLRTFEDRAGMGESFVYELGHRYTVSGHPELFILKKEELIIEEEEADDE